MWQQRGDYMRSIKCHVIFWIKSMNANNVRETVYVHSRFAALHWCRLSGCVCRCCNLSFIHFVHVHMWIASIQLTISINTILSFIFILLKRMFFFIEMIFFLCLQPYHFVAPFSLTGAIKMPVFFFRLSITLFNPFNIFGHFAVCDSGWCCCLNILNMQNYSHPLNYHFCCRKKKVKLLNHKVNIYCFGCSVFFFRLELHSWLRDAIEQKFVYDKFSWISF